MARFREIQLAESMFARLNLSSEQRQSAMAAFSRGKAPGFDLDADVANFARVSVASGRFW